VILSLSLEFLNPRDIPQGISQNRSGRLYALYKIYTLTHCTPSKHLNMQQLRRETSPTKASDVYAFGITLYEACSRREPYEGEDGHAVLRAVADPNMVQPKRPVIPQGCPVLMAGLMQECWLKSVAISFPKLDFVYVFMRMRICMYACMHVLLHACICV
jgi:hypothetical protein